ncbi:hypothetical protein Pcinc_044216 [Petrolisthes cinctipes]|uniref:High-affinity choline transporter 1 n=1 Tax=Petrolisthes cinctipes TaxID=88211 RepID=A0AAE1EEM8_PETCI|nr:hypothetical protein Pcinc_044216 [Petrolisthes cinctipes]
MWGMWIDYFLLLMLGGVPWQTFYQRILATRTGKQSQVLSFAGGLGCVIMVIPAIIIGIIAKGTDWPMTEYGKEIIDDDKKMVLPLVLQYLTPPWVAFLGLGAVSAAVMSSADSSVLSSSSMFANNLYKTIIRRKASDREVLWVMRGAVLVVGTIACLIAIRGKSITELFYLCSDFVYVMLYPQLTLAVHYPHLVNTYGSVVAYFVGFILRVLGVAGIPVMIEFPYYVDGVQYFPFRTLAMLVTFATMLLFSMAARKLYDAGHIKDYIGAFDRDNQPVVVATTKGHGGIEGVDNPGMDVSSEKTAGGGMNSVVERRKDSGHPGVEMERL